MSQAVGGPARADRILVPLDGSEPSDRILRYVRQIMVAEDAEATLVRVLPDRVARFEESFRMNARMKALSAQGSRINYELLIGEPAEAILGFARRYRPWVIAMWTHGRTGLDRWVHGSVTERILRQSRHPLFLANSMGLPQSDTRRRLRHRRILVPLDGSEPSARVLPLAIRFAQIFESQIVLLHAVHAEHSPLPPALPGQGPAGQEGEAVLEPYRKLVDRRGVPVTVRTRPEHPAIAILEAAKDEGVELVAMTTHGRSGVSRWVFGSVAEKVLRLCLCPLLLVRTGGFGEELLPPLPSAAPGAGRPLPVR